MRSLQEHLLKPNKFTVRIINDLQLKAFLECPYKPNGLFLCHHNDGKYTAVNNLECNEKLQINFFNSRGASLRWLWGMPYTSEVICYDL